MQTFYTFVGGIHEGPYNANQLKEKQLDSDTLIWTEGSTKWKVAAEIEELKDIVKAPKSDDYSKYEHEYAKTIWIIIFAIGVAICVFEAIKMLKK